MDIGFRELQHCNNCIKSVSTESGKGHKKTQFPRDLFVNRNEIFVPLHCQRKNTKFAACPDNKNYLRAR